MIFIFCIILYKKNIDQEINSNTFAHFIKDLIFSHSFNQVIRFPFNSSSFNFFFNSIKTLILIFIILILSYLSQNFPITPIRAIHLLYCIISEILFGLNRFRQLFTIFPEMLNSLSTPLSVAGTVYISSVICA